MYAIYFTFIGLCLGSFINALVWRLHKAGSKTKKAKKEKIIDKDRYSILRGRSMCVHCEHELKWIDLVPLFSWIYLKGSCRYCGKKISIQYPLVELITALLFLLSYTVILGNQNLTFTSFFELSTWLVFVVGFVALMIYDIRWMLLPNAIVYPLMVLALSISIFNAVATENIFLLTNTLLSVFVGGGIFWLIFHISNGRWIGGGDVKLGFLIGLILQDPYRSFIVIILASVIGTIFIVPGMVTGILSRKSRIPFGPFLIIATILVYLFGAQLINWYKVNILLIS